MSHKPKWKLEYNRLFQSLSEIIFNLEFYISPSIKNKDRVKLITGIWRLKKFLFF